MPTLLQIILLAVIQGAAELLPVSSSAHVIVGEKLLGLDPSSPGMTFLLVMLHTGTMFAVIVYFWAQWRALLLGQIPAEGQAGGFTSRLDFARSLIIATALTGVVGFGLKVVIEHLLARGGAGDKAEIEQLFSNLTLISVALFAAGLLIVISGRFAKSGAPSPLSSRHAAAIGVIQGLCLPFRGFSRSGATISVGMLTGLRKNIAESFSFALAVVLTPAVLAREVHRLLRDNAAAATPLDLGTMLTPGLIGMVASFIAGYLALKVLSNVLESGRWGFFGYYCFAAAAVVFYLGQSGY